MSALRHFVFDIGRVLIHYDPEIPFRRLIPDPARRARFLTDVCNDAWNAEQDRGRSFVEAEAALIARRPDETENIRAFRPCWAEMVPYAYEDSVAIMRGLIADGRDVTMLTNFSADTFAEARRLFPFLDEPRGVTVSGEIGIIKPEPAIYAHHARAFGLEPEATFFIDDSPRNVGAAIEAGWQAAQFTGAPALRRDLAARGVLLPRRP